MTSMKSNPLRAFVFLAFLTACATPPPAGMGPAFEKAMSAAKADSNPYEADETLTELLSSATLSDDQRARALYARGSLRRQAGDDRRGAVEDFEAMMKLAPEHPLAPNATEELEFAKGDVETIEAGLKKMLNLSQWFDSMWVLGDHDAAAERYRRSGLSPSEEQVAKLTADGYLCLDKGGDAPVFTVGDPRPDLENLHWCAAPDA
jgi:tetratricopeptide (TPR) repeat protein